ncbi:hypothetical protein SNEBB_008818 [Seison nebaliae]|nr:hypothetical protein SNEBB_008818 [Seison nebaliae]
MVIYMKRNIVMTILEILIPLLIAFPLFLIVRNIIPVNVKNTPTEWADYNPTNVIAPSVKLKKLVYAPHNAQTQRIMDNVHTYLSLTQPLVPYDSEGLMLNDVEEKNSEWLGVVIFETNPPISAGERYKITYKIRLPMRFRTTKKKTFWNTGRLSEGLSVRSTTKNPISIYGKPNYATDGFLGIQSAVDRAIMEDQIGTTPNSKAFGRDTIRMSPNLQRIPYPPYVVDSNVRTIETQLPLIFILAMVFVAILNVRQITVEKEMGMKELLKLHGIPRYLQWFIYFVKMCIIGLIFSLIVAGAFKIKLQPVNTAFKVAVLEHSSYGYIFIFFFLFYLSNITFIFLLSSIFSQGYTGAMGGGLLTFASYLPSTFLNGKIIPVAARCLLCLLPNFAFSSGTGVLSRLESTNIGLVTETVNEPSSLEDSFTFAHVFGMMVLDIFLYGLLAVYVDDVNPGQYGIAKKWYYIFPCCDVKNSVRDKSEEAEDKQFTNQRYQKPTIKIRKLKKVFTQGMCCKKTTKTAVCGLNMDVYGNEITAFLGQNGAGKSTTISMLTGIIAPTEGTMYVDDKYDLRRDLSSIRNNLGVCQQHNVFFEYMTVEEQLTFFAELKGAVNVKNEVDKYVEDLNLEEQRNKQAKKLSGGQKRRLCIGIAFCGNSKIVILDEPTAGVDPKARREIWKILLNQKKGKTIILTTHFMDEADNLGDRIAIMVKGNLMVQDTNHDLKNRYGKGYHLTCARLASEQEDVEEIEKELKENSKKINDWIKSTNFPKVELISEDSKELKFSIPKQGANEKLPKLLKELDSKMKEFRIASYGCSITTLEEVFLNVVENESIVSWSNDLLAVMQDQYGNHKAKIESVDERTIKYRVPKEHEEDLKKILEKEKKRLEDEKKMHKIDSIDFSSFESEVVASLILKDESTNEEQVENKKEIEELTNPSYTLISGWKLGLQQFRALFKKIFLGNIRNISLLLSQIFVPIITVILGVIAYKIFPTSLNQIQLPITFGNYSDTYIPYYIADSPTAQTAGEKTFITESIEKTFDLAKSLRRSDRPYKAQLHNVEDKFTDSKLQKCNEQTSMVDYTTCFGTEISISSYLSLHVMGLLFEKSLTNLHVTAQYESSYSHSAPLALNMASNTILQMIVSNEADTSKALINTVNHPLPATKEDIIDNQNSLSQNLGIFSIVVNLLMGFSFVFASFAAYIVKERISGAKLLQFISGINSVVYWFTNFLWNFIFYTIVSIIILILFAAFNIAYVVEDFEIGAQFFLLFLLYGPPGILSMFILSRFFNKSANAIAALSAFNMVTGMIMVIAVFIVASIEPNSKVPEILNTIFTIIFPNFAFGNGVLQFYSLQQTIFLCKTVPTLEHCDKKFDSIKEPGILLNIICLLLQGIILFLILIFLESNLSYQLKAKCTCQKKPWSYDKMKNDSLKPEKEIVTTNKIVETVIEIEPERPKTAIEVKPIKNKESEDVLREKQEIQNKSVKELSEQNILLINGAGKVYKDFVAVFPMYLKVGNGECFGLLGANGAGKTTTFKMLIGDETSTDGDIYVNGKKLETEAKDARKTVGYCPQFDSLSENIKGKELLEFYAKVRGVPKDKIKQNVESLLELLNLKDHADNYGTKYSGGNKRKLSTAIALVGNPKLILLDEPTSGMDVSARRYLWNVINAIRNTDGRSVILTTHSMEECEALCTRATIMMNGKFQCLNTIQNLKNIYGKGFNLKVKTMDGEQNKDEINSKGEVNMTKFIEWLNKQYSDENIEISNQCQNIAEIRISINEQGKTKDLKLAQIFEIMENNKAKLNIDDYSVSQSTLEQVFNTFASQQIDPSERMLK